MRDASHGRLVVAGLSLFAVLVSLPPAHAQQVVVPNGLVATEGNSNNGWPFSMDFQGRQQQVFSSSAFSAIAGPELITQIAFRPDGPFGTAFSTTLSDIQINLCTTTAAPDALSLLFADNVGADDTIVYGRGPLSLSSAYVGPVGGPMDFDIVVYLTTPFLYSPLAGNLLMDVRTFGGGRTTQFDADDTLHDSTSRTFSWDVNSASAYNGDSNGLVARFTLSPQSTVPEPGSLAFLAGILAPGVTILYRRRKSAR